MEKVEGVTGKHKAGKRERSARAEVELGNISHTHKAPVWESLPRRGSLGKALKDRRQKGNAMPWNRRQWAREEQPGDCRKGSQRVHGGQKGKHCKNWFLFRLKKEATGEHSASK